jgi:hypothetical protein
LFYYGFGIKLLYYYSRKPNKLHCLLLRIRVVSQRHYSLFNTDQSIACKPVTGEDAGIGFRCKGRYRGEKTSRETDDAGADTAAAADAVKSPAGNALRSPSPV